MPRVAELALQADLCYNQGRNIVVPEDAVNTSRRLATSTLLRRLVTMTTIPSTSGIYKITCTADNRIYIGSTSNLQVRRNSHFNFLRKNKHPNPIMQNAWNKYGEQAFTFEVLELVLPLDPTNREQYWLDKLKPFGRKGFNLARDARAPMRGTNGRKASPETREKQRLAQQNRNVSPENLQKMRQANLGRKQSPETIEKKRQSLIGKKHSPETIEKMRQANLGKKQSAEAIEKGRQARLGKKMSPEAIENMRQAQNTPERQEKRRQAQLGRKHTPETIEKMRQTHMLSGHTEKLRQVNLGNTYNLGRKQSPETIAKRVAKNTGKKRSPEAIEKTRQANLVRLARLKKEQST